MPVFVCVGSIVPIPCSLGLCKESYITDTAVILFSVGGGFLASVWDHAYPASCGIKVAADFFKGGIPCLLFHGFI